MQILDTAPNRPGRPLGRWIAATLGCLLILVGLVLLLPILTIVALVIIDLADDGQTVSPDADGILLLMATTVGAVVAWITGVKLLRGRPRTVLFLRRFGFDEAKSFVSYAAGRALGQRWRLVTLDDLSTSPVVIKKWKRRTLRLLVLLAIGFSGWLITEALQSLADPSVPTAETDNIGDAFGAMIAGIIVAVLVAVIILTLVSVTVAVTLAVGIASFFTSRSLARAERDSWTPIRRPQDLVDFLEMVENARSKLFAARVTVVRSTNELWRQAVAGLAGVSDAVLIDISDPSESLLWEIDMLSRRPDLELILIGDAGRLRALQMTGGHDADDRAVLNMLRNRPVLAYDNDQRSFARELRHMLDSTVTVDD